MSLVSSTKCPSGGFYMDKNGKEKERTIGKSGRKTFRSVNGITFISCSKETGCGYSHTKDDFANITIIPPIQAQDDKELEDVQAQVQSTELSEETPEEQNKKKVGRPKAPEATIVQLYTSKETMRNAANRIADAFEELMNDKTAKKKVDIPEWKRSEIWINYNNFLSSIMCPCCNLRVITKESFSAGHIIPESRNGPSQIDNFIPICIPCNTRCGTHHLYWFAWHVYGRILWNLETS